MEMCQQAVQAIAAAHVTGTQEICIVRGKLCGIDQISLLPCGCYT